MKYQAPILKTIRIGNTSLMNESLPKSTGDAGDNAECKAFWGPSLFEEETEEDNLFFEE